MYRRDVLRGALAGAATLSPAWSTLAAAATENADGVYDVRRFGARGDGAAIDSPAVNKAIAYAAAHGGGVVRVPAGVYACYSIRLQSRITLELAPGAVILAAEPGGSGAGYDHSEPQGPFEAYQDYGHNHWRNSLIWGENLQDVAIVGPGLIYGRGLSRGHRLDTDPPDISAPGVGNKAIALKTCRGVTLRDFRVLKGGWFAILVTGVDNLTIDNLLLDTDRDGMDIDCCRNVRISNCTVNSPWDDGICPKSSFALGYPRSTENLTITGCYVTGGYQLGSVLDGSWKRLPLDFPSHGRIKCGTESNGGFKAITITGCVFDSCYGLALETADGAICEDITVSNIAMRGIRNAPLFLRLERRMRGPAGAGVGALRRVLIENVVSSGAAPLPSILAGVPGYPVEDIRISGLVQQQRGGGSAELAAKTPPELETGYPEPAMFGALPATGLFIRHARNVEIDRMEVEVDAPDPRPAVWAADVAGLDVSRLKAPFGAPAFALYDVTDFSATNDVRRSDVRLDGPVTRTL